MNNNKTAEKTISTAQALTLQQHSPNTNQHYPVTSNLTQYPETIQYNLMQTPPHFERQMQNQIQNYNQQQPIYTVPIPTTSRATTPILPNWSGTEESSTSDDDDCISWQEVRNGKGRKRASAARTPTPKKNKQLGTVDSTQVRTMNRYEPLQNTEAQDNNNKEKQTNDPKPPPIFIPRILDVKRLTALIEETVNRKDYTLKIDNKDTIKIITTKLEHHKSVYNMLKDKKVEFHTYQPRHQRSFRVVIRNLHHSLNQELITEEIEKMGHKVRNLWNIRDKNTGKQLSLFFLDLEPDINNKEIYHIEYLQNMKVIIEPPHHKKNIPQCKRCQAFFHTKGYCHHKPRCVKCGEEHSTAECKLPNSQPAKCLHCGDSHPASYQGCKVYQKIISSRFPPRPPKTDIHPTNTIRTENAIPNNTQQIKVATEMSYAQATKNNLETHNTLRSTTDDTSLVKILQDTFTRFEAILNRQAEQMNTLMQLLTTILNKLVK